MWHAILPISWTQRRHSITSKTWRSFDRTWHVHETRTYLHLYITHSLRLHFLSSDQCGHYYWLSISYHSWIKIWFSLYWCLDAAWWVHAHPSWLNMTFCSYYSVLKLYGFLDDGIIATFLLAFLSILTIHSWWILNYERVWLWRLHLILELSYLLWGFFSD